MIAPRDIAPADMRRLTIRSARRAVRFTEGSG